MSHEIVTKLLVFEPETDSAYEVTVQLHGIQHNQSPPTFGELTIAYRSEDDRYQDEADLISIETSLFRRIVQEYCNATGESFAPYATTQEDWND